jgi:hypothetical protein
MSSTHSAAGKANVVVGGPFSHFTVVNNAPSNSAALGPTLAAANEAILDFKLPDWKSTLGLPISVTGMDRDNFLVVSQYFETQLRAACTEAGASIIIEPQTILNWPYILVGVGLSESDATVIFNLETGEGYASAQVCCGVSALAVVNNLAHAIKAIPLTDATSYHRGEITPINNHTPALAFHPTARSLTSQTGCREAPVTQLVADTWGIVANNPDDMCLYLDRLMPTGMRVCAKSQSRIVNSHNFYDQNGIPAGATLLVMFRGRCSEGKPTVGFASGHSFPNAYILDARGKITEGLVTWTLTMAGAARGYFQTPILIANSVLKSGLGLRPPSPYECHSKILYRGLGV